MHWKPYQWRGHEAIAVFDAEGRPHRLDGPAIQVAPTSEGHSFEIWMDHGELHRAHGPAVSIWGQGYFEWRVHGVLHRVGGPALINKPFGVEEWRQLGELHREDGPAKLAQGREEWWLEGNLHRLDGPAVIAGDHESYHLWGQEVKKEEWDLLKDKPHSLDEDYDAILGSEPAPRPLNSIEDFLKAFDENNP